MDQKFDLRISVQDSSEKTYADMKNIPPPKPSGNFMHKKRGDMAYTG